jgi:hypothetical protein
MHLAQQSVPDLTAWLIGTPVTVLAAVTWAWMTGRIVTGGALAKAEQRAERAEAELRRIAESDRVVLVPALTRATDVLANYVVRKTDEEPPPRPTRPPRGQR